MAGGSLAGILDYRGSSMELKSKRKGKGSETLFGGLDEDEIKCVTRQVVNGLAYLHEQGFLHVRTLIS